MSRRQARIRAFELVFQLPFHNKADTHKIYENSLNEEAREKDRYIVSAFNGVTQNLEQIDKLIKNNLQSWEMDRVAAADLAALRLCTYEFLFEPDIPKAVSVNEAVLLAKVYGTDESYIFVNGVCAGILKEIGS